MRKHQLRKLIVITCDVISTEKVDYPHQELEPEKSKDNPTLEAVELPCDINETIEDSIDDNSTAEAAELPCDETSDTANRVLTTEVIT